MPLILPKNLINRDLLEKEKIFIMGEKKASSQDIRPLKIALVNLMPNKEETEIQILRLLSNQVLQIDVDLVRTASYEPKNSDLERLKEFYKTYDEIKNNKYDAMIITGAPLEKVEYNNIKYWEELKEIFEFAKKNVYSTMFICWATQAALHYYYNVNANLSNNKIFGIYPFKRKSESKLLEGLDDIFFIPQSRYTFVNENQLEAIDDFEVLASSDETGVTLAKTKDNRFIFNFGHLEYDRETLHKEFFRDLNKGLNVEKPYNYYFGESKVENINMNWKSTASIFFNNWLNYAVYQSTPFDIESIKTKSVSKFGGSSLSDANQFQKVKNIISSDEDRNIIVVSAPGKRHPLDIKITDILIEIYNKNYELSEIDLIIRSLVEKKEKVALDVKEKSMVIKERFEEIVDNLKLKNQLKDDIDETVNQIINSNSRDFILSRGEYLNAKLMAEFLNYKFIDAKDLIFFSEDGVDLDKTYSVIRKLIKADEKVVVPGFYGNKNGEIKVFNRGGSDYTGSILASALETNVYENWTDVNGIMNADPNIDKNARKYENLKYSELEEIIQSGASVYQQEAIKPVMDKNITIRILNTNNPKDDGTWIKD